jgi:hypothetical protein
MPRDPRTPNRDEGDEGEHYRKERRQRAIAHGFRWKDGRHREFDDEPRWYHNEQERSHRQGKLLRGDFWAVHVALLNFASSGHACSIL